MASLMVRGKSRMPNGRFVELVLVVTRVYCVLHVQLVETTMRHWSRAPSLRRAEQLLWDGAPSSVGRTARTFVGSFEQLSGMGCRRFSQLSGNGLSASRALLSPRGRRDWLAPTSRRSASNTASNGTGILSTTTQHSPGHTIATLSVSNPAKLNIVNSALLQDLIQACHNLSKDHTLRAVVLTSAPVNAGKAASWIGGADIKEMAALSSSQQARAFIDRIHAACEALRAIPVPVIASIDGFCLGAGMEIAASCDLRVATKESVFGMPEVKVGIPSVVEAAYLPGLVGMGRTRRLLYLAENLDAVTAERWGFVEKVVADGGQLERATGEWVEMLVGMGPKAIRSQKKLMQKWENCGVEEGIEAGAEAYADAFADGGVEPKEYMGKFLGRKR